MLKKIKRKIAKKIKNIAGSPLLERQIAVMELENQYLRDIMKECRPVRNNPKIMVVFVVHRPQIWSSLKSVCDECIKDERFDVKIVATPNKIQLPDLGLDHEQYQSEGAEEFFSQNYDCVINGYNYETGEWFDLFNLRPDYVFFQTPYNICRPLLYQSSVVSAYADICFTPYGVQTLGGEVEESVYPIDFIKDVKYLFMESSVRRTYFENLLKKNLKYDCNNLYSLGYPRFDNLDCYKNIESKAWLFPREKGLYRIMWTPRWLTEEGNCHFFDYKEKIIELAEKNSNTIEILFRPHPQAFANFIATGEMSEQQLGELKEKYDKMENASIDEQASYIESFYSSDLLITDASSIIPEYFLTGKPIIYCHKTWNDFTDFGRQLSEGFYWANNWDEVNAFVNELMAGHDPLQAKRQKIIQDLFEISDVSAGYRIKELLAERSMLRWL